jgi:hypothetical protein
MADERDLERETKNILLTEIARTTLGQPPQHLLELAEAWRVLTGETPNETQPAQH